MRPGRQRFNYPDEPTEDPVELERKLIAQAKAEVESEPYPTHPGGWTPLQRFAVFVTLALVGVYLVLWAGAVQGSGGPEGYVRVTDFISTLTGATIIRQGDGSRLYDMDTQRATQRRYITLASPDAPAKLVAYDRPPFEALLVSPLVDMPYWVAFALWTLAAGLAMGLSIGLLDGALPVYRSVGWVMSLAACSYLPAIRSLMLGQNSLFVLMGLSGTYLALKRGHDTWAAVSLLLVALRPQILPVVLLVLLLQRHFRALALFLAFLALLSVAATPALNLGWPVDYVRFLFESAGGQFGLATPLFVLLLLASVGALVWAWMRSRDEGAPEDVDDEYAEPRYDLLWAMAGLVAVLIAIYFNPQDLTLLVFPAWIVAAYVTSGLWSKGISRLWLVMLWAGYALAPITLYLSTTGGNATLPFALTVLLISLSIGLLAWQVGVGGDGSSRSFSSEF